MCSKRRTISYARVTIVNCHIALQTQHRGATHDGIGEHYIEFVFFTGMSQAFTTFRFNTPHVLKIGQKKHASGLPDVFKLFHILVKSANTDLDATVSTLIELYKKNRPLWTKELYFLNSMQCLRLILISVRATCHYFELDKVYFFFQFCSFLRFTFPIIHSV